MRRWRGMSICQTSPRLEKRPGAFCFLRSEKRPANRTGFPRAPTQGTETFRQVSLYVVFCRSLSGMSMPLLVSCYVLLAYYALPYCRFHGAVVDVEASRITCCRGCFTSPVSTSLRRHFSLLLRHRQPWSTCLSQDFSRALAGGIIAA